MLRGFKTSFTMPSYCGVVWGGTECIHYSWATVLR